AIYEGRAGMLWIGTFGGGVSKYSRVAAKFALYRHRANDPNSLNDDLVFAICEDQDGALWIGTFQGGLNIGVWTKWFDIMI
ncbi:MAG: hypothetical protein GY767_11660, partial [Shimia sp.]|nr:hypothetical protein [Shimia sp.]